MGFNTTVVLYNDQTSSWPERIKRAMQNWERPALRKGRLDERGHFGFGHIVAVEHSDVSQVCVVGQNLGRYLLSFEPPEIEGDLQALAKVLEGHGWKCSPPEENPNDR